MYNINEHAGLCTLFKPLMLAGSFGFIFIELKVVTFNV